MRFTATSPSSSRARPLSSTQYTATPPARGRSTQVAGCSAMISSCAVVGDGGGGVSAQSRGCVLSVEVDGDADVADPRGVETLDAGCRLVIGGAGERGAGGLHVADVADGDAAAAGIEDGDSLGGGVAELGEHAVGGRGWAGRDCIELLQHGVDGRVARHRAGGERIVAEVGPWAGEAAGEQQRRECENGQATARHRRGAY